MEDIISRLPSGPFYEALDFLQFQDIIRCSSVNKAVYTSLFDQTHLLFRSLLDRDFPCYPPFRHLQNKDCFLKLKSFFKRDFQWKRLGSCCDVQPRYLHRSAITADGEMIFFGGFGRSYTHFNDSWKVAYTEGESSNVTFQNYRTECAAKPSPRGGSTMCIYQRYAFCFGGRDANGTFLNSLHSMSIDTGEWTQVRCDSSEFPPPRWGHTIVEWRGLLILFGGGEYGKTYNDLWALDLKTLQKSDVDNCWVMTQGWKQIMSYVVSPAANNILQPAGRSGHMCVIMQEHYLYVHGGNDLQETFNDMWRISLLDVNECCGGKGIINVSWELVTPISGSPYPLPQIGHVAVPLGTYKFILYGGRDIRGGGMIEGTMLYDTRDNKWECCDNIAGHEMISNRTGHCPLPTTNGILFVGGLLESQNYTSEVICLELFTSHEPTSKNSSFSFKNILGSIYKDWIGSSTQNNIKVMRGPDIFA